MVLRAADSPSIEMAGWLAGMQFIVDYASQGAIAVNLQVSDASPPRLRRSSPGASGWRGHMVSASDQHRPMPFIGAGALSPDAVAVTIAVAVPVLTATITPTAAAIPLDFPAPTISQVNYIDPSPVTIPFIIPNPTVTSSSALTPAPIAMVFVIPAPTIRVGLRGGARILIF